MAGTDYHKKVKNRPSTQFFTTLIHQDQVYVSISFCSSPLALSASTLRCSRSSSELQALCCLPREKILRRDWVLRSSRSKESEEKRLSSLTTLDGRLRRPSPPPVAWRSCCRASGNIVVAEEGVKWWSSGRSRLRENLPLRFRIPFLLLTASVRMVGLSSAAGREECSLWEHRSPASLSLTNVPEIPFSEDEPQPDSPPYKFFSIPFLGILDEG